MPVATAPMPKKKPAPTEHAVYRLLKVDADVLTLVRLAVAHLAAEGKPTSMQEAASDVLNRWAADVTGRQPVPRKPPPDKPKGKGRPPKR